MPGPQIIFCTDLWQSAVAIRQSLLVRVSPWKIRYKWADKTWFSELSAIVELEWCHVAEVMIFA